MVLVALVGCGGEPSKLPLARLAGKVTIDNVPVAEGSLVIIPQGKNPGQTTGCPISGGSYDCPTVPKGEILVRFIAAKETGEIDKSYSTPRPVKASIVPKKYDEGIKLTVEQDDLAHHFDLTN